MADKDRRTLIEDGTEIEGNIKSNCPVALNGKVDGKVSAPSLKVTKTGSVHGRVKVDQLNSEGEVSGEIDADTVRLSGKVNDDTVIKANTLEVNLEKADGGLRVAFGNCRLKVGDPTDNDQQSESSEREREDSHARREPQRL